MSAYDGWLATLDAPAGAERGTIVPNLERVSTVMDLASLLGIARSERRISRRTFLAYGAGPIPASIWMGKPWSVATKEVFDGLVYGLVTAGTFGWLWPR